MSENNGSVAVAGLPAMSPSGIDAVHLPGGVSEYNLPGEMPTQQEALAAMEAENLAQTVAQVITEAPAPIFEKAVCLAIETGKLGNRRKLSTSKIEVDADKDMIAVSKQLLVSKELKEVEKLDGEMRRWIAKKCLPSMFKDGVYLLPIPLVETVYAKLKKFKTEREKLVADFLLVYEEQKTNAQERLKDCFDPTEYPPIEVVASSFRLDWKVVTFGLPGQIQEISPTIFAEEREKASVHWQEATDEITLLLRQTAAELTEHLIERLTPDAEGSKKTFKNTLVANVKEFLNDFEMRNIANDAALGEQISKMRDLLKGVDAEDLRQFKSVRERVRAGMVEVKAQLDEMLVNAPKRAITFDAV